MALDYYLTMIYFDGTQGVRNGFYAIERWRAIRPAPLPKSQATVKRSRRASTASRGRTLLNLDAANVFPPARGVKPHRWAVCLFPSTEGDAIAVGSEYVLPTCPGHPSRSAS